MPIAANPLLEREAETEAIGRALDGLADGEGRPIVIEGPPGIGKSAGVDPADVSVECPDDPPGDEGAEFDCDLTAPNGDVVTVNVEITGPDGEFHAVVPPQQS